LYLPGCFYICINAPTSIVYTDRELAEMLERDPDRAIGFIFERYYAFLCKVVFRILSDVNTAEDLVQEVFYELWKKQRELSIQTSLKAYLRQSCRNKALNFIRDNRRVFLREEPEERPQRYWDSPQSQMEGAELQAFIDEVIDGLPERCRVVFILSRFEDMSYSEIAEHLGISAKTVENQISKALRLLREALRGYGCWLVGFLAQIFFIYLQ